MSKKYHFDKHHSKFIPIERSHGDKKHTVYAVSDKLKIFESKLNALSQVCVVINFNNCEISFEGILLRYVNSCSADMNKSVYV